MSRVAFVTCTKLAGLVEEDLQVARALAGRGVNVVPAIWDAPEVDWPSFDAVVIRSAWDYHLAPGRYEAWLRARAADGTRLWNPPAHILANVHKRYLSAFARAGVPIVPSVFLDAADGRVLRGELDALNCDDAVVKPAVSANATGTWRVSRASADAHQARFAEQARSEDLLLQPYLPEIASEGEWSLMFFDGEYSHAVVKRPAAGEFRVQEHLGGGAVPADPPAALIRRALAVLDAQRALAGAQDEPPLLYARVDGIQRDGQFLLMELEINEPSLFIGVSPGAADRFADAILARSHA